MSPARSWRRPLLPEARSRRRSRGPLLPARPPAVRRGEQASPGFDFFFFHVIFYSRAILNLLANFFLDLLILKVMHL